MKILVFFIEKTVFVCYNFLMRDSYQNLCFLIVTAFLMDEPCGIPSASCKR